MKALDDCKKELQNLRDACDKLVKCLQDAAQSENLEDFRAGVECADEMTIILGADLFQLMLKANQSINAEKDEAKEVVVESIAVETVSVEPLKSEVIEAIPVAEAKNPEIEKLKEEIIEAIKEEPIKVEPPKEEVKSVEL